MKKYKKESRRTGTSYIYE